MPETSWLMSTSSAFRLMIATSWLAPDSWRERQEQAIREALDAGPDWNEYLQLVDRHGTPGLSWAALGRVAGIVLPELVRQELQKRSDGCRKQAIVDCLLLGDVLKRLNRAGIPAMPLKGQVLSFALYQDVGLRFSRDLDVEVERENIEKAQACIESKQWELESTFFPLSPLQWQSFLRNEQHINFVHSQTGRTLELHWRNQWETPEATSARWARSVAAVWQGRSIHVMNPCDMALYLCSHGGHHAWFRAKWLGDLARAHSLGLLDWDAALIEARRGKHERVLRVGIFLLDQLYGLAVPHLPVDARMDRPSPLIETPLQALKDPEVPAFRTDPASLLYRLRMSRYQRLLRPQKAWRESLSELFYQREDFRMLSIPDRFFWAYKLLRPVLWIWRWARQSRGQAANCRG